MQINKGFNIGVILEESRLHRDDDEFGTVGTDLGRKPGKYSRFYQNQ